MMGTGFFFGGGFEIIFFLMFFLITGMIVFAIVQGLRQWNRNNRSPRLTVEAEVVAKRTEVTHHHHNSGSGMGHSHSTTWYYATFQVASGDRMEFAVGGGEYGLLAEGDRGQLTFQGTRYLGFERER